MTIKIEKITQQLKKYFEASGFKKAVIGLSGGVDSSLTAKLSVMALGKENVTGILMPNEGFSSDHSVSDALAWATELGIEHHTVPIKHLVQHYEHLPWKSSPEAHMNLQARVRMTILYHYANSHRALVVGTGNKSELRLGYFTKHGDGAADISPIGNLYKMEVWEMAKTLDLPKAIIQKAPSAELKNNHTDEGELGMSYQEIDAILNKFDEGLKAKNKKEIEIWNRVKANAHKLETAPILK